MTDPRTPEVALEPMRWWDIPAVARIEMQLFAGDSAWTEAMFWSELAAGYHYLTAWEGPDLVGYTGLATGPELADLQTVGVRRDRQGRGIGRRLLAAMLAEAGDLPVVLEVRTDNEPAIAMYEGFGFTRVGVRRRYYQESGADAFTMVRET